MQKVCGSYECKFRTMQCLHNKLSFNAKIVLKPTDYPRIFRCMMNFGDNSVIWMERTLITNYFANDQRSYYDSSSDICNSIFVETFMPSPCGMSNPLCGEAFCDTLVKKAELQFEIWRHRLVPIDWYSQLLNCEVKYFSFWKITCLEKLDRGDWQFLVEQR